MDHAMLPEHSSPLSDCDSSRKNASLSMSGVTRKAVPAQLKNQKTVTNIMSFKSTGQLDLDRTSKAEKKALFAKQTSAHRGLLEHFTMSPGTLIADLFNALQHRTKSYPMRVVLRLQWRCESALYN